MKKGFLVLLFFTCLVYLYAESVFTASPQSFLLGTRTLANAGRWMGLAMLCLFMLSSPRLVFGECQGKALKGFAVAMAILATFSCVYAFLPGYEGLRARPVYVLSRGLSLAFLVVFLFFSLWPRLKRTADYISLFSVFIALGWSVVFLNLAVYFGAPGLAIRPATGAFQGFFGNPNSLGMTCAIILPVAVASFHMKKRVTGIVLAGAMVGFILWCGSRASLLGGGFGVGAFYATYYGKKLWLPIILVVLIAAPIMIARDQGSVDEEDTAPAQGGFLAGESTMDEYGSGRIGLWLYGLERFKVHPFTGYGFGTGGDLYLSDGNYFRWHSSFVQISLELGMIGVFFFLAPIFYSSIRVARYHMGDIRDDMLRAVTGGFAGLWFAGVVDSFFESWLFSVGNPTSVITWIAFAAGMKAMSDARRLSLEGLEGRRLQPQPDPRAGQWPHRVMGPRVR